MANALLRREVAAAVEIDAPIDAVWEALVDLPRYPEWNSFTRRVEGELVVGTPVRLRVDMPRRSESWQVETVTEFDEAARRFAWGMTMGAPFLLRANRVQQLEALPSGRTRYTTVDRFGGVLVPLVMALYGGPMQAGFGAMAEDLRRYLEERR